MTLATWIAQNLQWLITVFIGFVVWIIRLEGIVKSLRNSFTSELQIRDSQITAIKNEQDHITRSAENLKQEFGSVLLDTKGNVDRILGKLEGLESAIRNLQTK